MLTETHQMTDWERLKHATSWAVVIAAGGIVTLITLLYLIFGS